MLRRLPLALLLLVLSACAGTAARQHVLLPSLRSAWPDVEVDVTAGINDGINTQRLDGAAAEALRSQRNAFGAALASGEATKTAPLLWPPLEPEALNGVEARRKKGELGDGVAKELKERDLQFGRGIRVMGER